MQNQEIFKKPVWKAIFSMGIPSLISVLVMIIYNMADMYFIGFLNDYTQVAAVSLIMPVFSIMTAVSMLLGNGGCTLIAQALGAGEKKRARSYLDSHFIRSDYSRSDYSFFESFVEIPRNQ